ncbi:hypothetical protein VTJ04DRAFT_4984 [Mycothermus thermophilus]|uniref:uncharacterized protein n=1 Tax=Humicola insolens TaxID=85995 RepID=UPI003742DAFF
MLTKTPPKSGHRPLLLLSTKMYFSHSDTLSYTTSLLTLLSSLPTNSNSLQHLDVYLLPDFLSLPSVLALLSSHPSTSGNHRLLVGAQDCSPHDYGACTGDVSPAVLRELGVRLVAVGHAERRGACPGNGNGKGNGRGETDEEVHLKACAAARNGLVPLICVGERERPLELTSPDVGGTEEGVEKAAREVVRQVEAAFGREFRDGEVFGESEVVVAYEPVWAIGAEEPASVEHVVGVVRRVRESEVLQGREGKTRIVYGGAAGLGLWERLEGEVDGLFLGRFAHRPEMFVEVMYEVAGVSGLTAEKGRE